jgi:hypothetical protein
MTSKMAGSGTLESNEEEYKLTDNQIIMTT